MKTFIICLLLSGCSTYQLTINRDITVNGKPYGSVGVDLNPYSNTYYINDGSSRLQLQGKHK